MNFEETYRTSYSHGLESIYAIETVDLRSVRKFQKVEEKPKPSSAPPRFSSSPQLTFDFGPGFREWVVPTLLNEPLQVLGLHRQAEKSLLDRGKSCLGDLIKTDTLKGIGQGHLDEIQSKLSAYLAGKECSQARLVDYGSWLRTLIPKEQRLRCFLLLDSFGIAGLLPLGMSESSDIRRLTQDQRQRWKEEALRFLRTPLTQNKIQQFVDELVNALVVPWMRKRTGLATEDELLERCEKRSLTPPETEQILRFTGLALGVEGFLLSRFIPMPESSVYAADASHEESYKTVVAYAKSYFRTPGQWYPLTHLISLIERELASLWQGYEEGFVEKTLRLSPTFRLLRRESGGLAVREIGMYLKVIP